MNLSDYALLAALLSPVLLVAYGVGVYERRKLLNDPEAIAAAFDAIHQEQLLAAELRDEEPLEFDFIISAASLPSAEAVAARLRDSGYTVATEGVDEELGCVLAVSRWLKPSEVNFRSTRISLLELCSGLQTQYIGPGSKTLERIGLPQGRASAA